MAQNSAARLLTKTKLREHITPILYNLHWLPVYQRIKYKILCIIHKTVNSDVSPVYLQSIITLCNPVRNLRSSSDPHKLLVKRTRNAYGDRLPSSIGATWWNNLPITLRSSSHDSFKRGLKTILFNEHFN